MLQKGRRGRWVHERKTAAWGALETEKEHAWLYTESACSGDDSPSCLQSQSLPQAGQDLESYNPL